MLVIGPPPFSGHKLNTEESPGKFPSAQVIDEMKVKCLVEKVNHF